MKLTIKKALLILGLLQVPGLLMASEINHILDGLFPILVALASIAGLAIVLTITNFLLNEKKYKTLSRILGVMSMIVGLLCIVIGVLGINFMPLLSAPMLILGSLVLVSS